MNFALRIGTTLPLAARCSNDLAIRREIDTMVIEARKAANVTVIEYEKENEVARQHVLTEGLAFSWAQSQAHDKDLDPAIVWLDSSQGGLVGMTSDARKFHGETGQLPRQWFEIIKPIA